MPANIIAIDTEWFQMEGRLHRPGGIFACLSTTDGLGVQTSGASPLLFVDKPTTKKYLSTLKKEFDGVLAIQNAEFDIRQLRHLGLWPEGWTPNLLDTMIVEQDLFGGWYQSFSLAAMSRRWLNTYLPKDTVSSFRDGKILTATQSKYALKDAKSTRGIAEKQIEYVEDEYGGDFNWYWEIDLPAMWATLDMPPIRMDVPGWLAYAQQLREEGDAIQEKLGFNVKSQPQVQEALRGTGLRIRADGSCDQNALVGWLQEARNTGNKKRAKFLEQIMRARHCRDAFSKYGNKWVAENVEDNEWVYPNWKVTGAETGRMACSDPNMMNIPKRGEDSVYRSFFVASPGNTLLVADVQQQEPRFSAYLSKDETLRQEIMEGIDLHQVHADMFGTDRPTGKKINLSLNYLISAYSLATQTGMPVEEIEEGIRQRRMHYPMYYSWMDRQQRFAEKNNYVTTVTGRRIWTNPYNFQAIRNAVNGPIQGSSADQTKLALRYVWEECLAGSLPFAVIMVVHDEMVLDIPKKMAPKYKKIVNDAFQEAGKQLMPSIPTVIEFRTGNTWRADVE